MDKNFSVTIIDKMIKMSDGVRLFTRVALPGDGSGKYPTVFMRTPYDPETEISKGTYSRYGNDPFIRRGYAVVLQHCRGRFGSEGECIPYSEEERRDGIETLDIIRHMPHYNGELFLEGGSYTASVLMLMLDEDIPDVKGISFSVQTESMYHRNFFNGLCRSFSGFEWWLYMISEQHRKIADDKDIYIRPYKDIMKRAVGVDIPAFTNTLVNDRYNDFWKNDHRTGIIEKLHVPVLFVSGWYDYYCFGMCSMWEKLPSGTKERSCFIMGPWGHSGTVPCDSEYPFPHGNIPVDRSALWFDSIRCGTPFPYGELGKFNYYSMGEDSWNTASGPYETDRCLKLYPTSDGKLSVTAPESSTLSYVYDPENRKKSDRHDYIFKAYGVGEFDDVLSFVSEEFTEKTSFFGPVKISADLSSDCDDTAFFIRVYLIEDGVPYNIVDAATTLLHADPDYRCGGLCHAEFLTQPTAFTLKAGCKLRVDISSYSDCFVPHANTARNFAYETETRVANNTVFIGKTNICFPIKR